MFRKLREKISIFTVKQPSLTILLAIFVLNLILFAVAAIVISLLSPRSLSEHGFWASVFYTISMVLDAGCVQYVIADIGQASVALIIVCLVTVLIGMITFTGSIVGYVTNYIANFINSTKAGSRSVRVSGHTVILNWNSRASEIVNDLFYSDRKETVIILSGQNSAEIEAEISERLSTTFKDELNSARKECASFPFLKRAVYMRKHRPRNNVTVIVREGETYSTKQLNDISISQAASIILLNKEYQNEVCQYANTERRELLEKGNANTIKTLVQVAEMTSSESSADNQTIIVEVLDEWTAKLVERITAHKEKLAKCHIIPVYVNRVLGQILSQFSVMPELNTVYSELFSNKGAEFFFKVHRLEKELTEEIRQYMLTHTRALPLTIMETPTGSHAYYVAESSADCWQTSEPVRPSMSVELNKDFYLLPRNIVIIGHNSKCQDIMNGFASFRGEHKLPDREILNITVIDDEKSLERLDYYKAFPYVTKTVAADVFDGELIKETIEKSIDSHDGDTSLLILSDDTTVTEDIDSAALTYLIYVQDIILSRQEKDPDFDRESIDVVVEILNPKNYDVVRNFSADNVVISNRYISKMVTQIGRKQALFEFFSDILTYDEEDAEVYVSKELYIKEADRFFAEGAIPSRCTARELIWGVYEASPVENKAIVLGYTSPGGKMTIFAGDQQDITVELTPKDKLIIYSNH